MYGIETIRKLNAENGVKRAGKQKVNRPQERSENSVCQPIRIETGFDCVSGSQSCCAQKQNLQDAA